MMKKTQEDLDKLMNKDEPKMKKIDTETL
nr:hypothetical protein [Tanacetum cinerariifolium]